MTRAQILRRLLQTLALATSTLFLTHCGKTADTPTTTASFASIYTTILGTACIQCHVPGQPVYVTRGVRLDFTNASVAYTTLTNNLVAGQSSTGTCSGIKIVQAGATNQSYLAGVLFQDYHIANFAGVTNCTPYANHLSDQNISASQEAAIVSWINAGAANN